MIEIIGFEKYVRVKVTRVNMLILTPMGSFISFSQILKLYYEQLCFIE
jgi:hypothetical protein